jgi:hypothetical protein
MAEHWTTQVPLANPYPEGDRFTHNTTRKDVNHLPPQPQPALTGSSPDIHFKAVTISPEARRIARILGLRSAEYLAQRLIDAEDNITSLVARVEKLEAKKRTA